MWPYDTAEANWLAVGDPSRNAETATIRDSQKAAAPTAAVHAMTDTAIPAAANCNAPAPRGGILGRIIAGLRAWRVRSDARETLYGMTDRELADIGLTRDDIAHVTAKRAPAKPAAVAPRPVTGTAMGAGVMGNALMGLTRGATRWDNAA